MKKKIKSALSLLLVLLLLQAPALAAGDGFGDVTGHWAEQALLLAVDDGLLRGFGDGTLRPELAVSGAEVITLLCRILRPVGTAPLSELGLGGGEWYAADAARAASIGLRLDSYEGELSRRAALCLIAEAFQLRLAEPDYSCLTGYGDAQTLSGTELDAIASLVSAGYIAGYDGSLGLERSISRAELVTLLYRIAPARSDSSELRDRPAAAIVLSGSAKLEDRVFTEPVYLDCTTGSVSLDNVKAATLVVRSEGIKEIKLSGGSSVARLVLAGSPSETLDEPIYIAPTGDCSIGTLVIGSYGGDVHVGGSIERLELNGSGCGVTLRRSIDELVISGSGNTLSVRSGNAANIGRLALTSGSFGNEVTLSKSIAGCELDGSDNSLRLSGDIKKLYLRGGGNSVSGSGRVDEYFQCSSRSTMELTYSSMEDLRDYGIEDAAVTLDAPESLPAGGTLTVTAKLENATRRSVTASWIVDGEIKETLPVTLTDRAQELSFTPEYEYSETMPASSKIELLLSYTTEDGARQTLSRSVTVRIENYSREYYEKYRRERVLEIVQTGYQGDWTTEWALENDYDRQTKEIWLNAKGHTSETDYILWISISHQRVNVFKRAAGGWELINEYLCGTGAPGSGTPVGVYTVWARSEAGWTTGTYNVRPVVNFRTGSGYAFHSRLYDPGHNYLTDPGIGYPISHGCIRMYDEDVQWIYDNIPNQTTVVVF